MFYFVGIDGVTKQKGISIVEEEGGDLLYFDAVKVLAVGGGTVGSRLATKIYATDLDLSGTLTGGTHALGGASHTIDILANLNLKISDANLDDSGSSRTPSAHKNTHESSGSDPFDASDLLEAHVKRLKESSGPTVMTLGAIADGEYLKRSGSDVVGGTPGGGTSYYYVAATTITTADLNTALTNYDVVYLPVGTYSNVTGKVIIPSNKALLGLCNDNLSSSTYAPQITLTTSAAVYIDMATGARLENVRLIMAAGSTSAMVHGVNGVCKYVANKTASGVILQYAFSGSFHEVKHCSAEDMHGITITSFPTMQGGVQEISYFRWDGGNGNTKGIFSSTAYIHVHHCTLDNGQDGLLFSGTSCLIDNIRTSSNSDYAVEVTGDRCVITNITSYMDTNGVKLQGDKCVASNITIDNPVTTGLYLYTYNYSTITGVSIYAAVQGVYAYACTHAALSDITVKGGTGHGIYIWACSYFTGTGLVAKDNTGATTIGVYALSCNYSVFSNLIAYNNGDYGIKISGGTSITGSSFTAYNNGDHGVFISGDYLAFSTISSKSNTGSGLYADAVCDGVQISGVEAHANGSWGVQILSGGTTQRNHIQGIVANGNTTGEISIGTGWDGLEYYTVSTTVTTADLNSALNTYNTIYLPVGTYSNVTGKVTVPTNKALVGLCSGNMNSSTYAPQITLTTSATVYVDLQIGARLEYVRLVAGAGSAHAVVQGSYAICRYVAVYSAAAQNYYAFAGGFEEVMHCSAYNLSGIAITAAGSDSCGPIEIGFFYGYGNAGTCTRGITSTLAYLKIHNVTLSGYERGIYTTGAYVQVNNVYTNVCTGYGVKMEGNNCTISDVVSYSDQIGIELKGDYCGTGTITAYNSTSHGVMLNTYRNGAAGTLTSYSHGGYGIYIYDCDKTTVAAVGGHSGTTASCHGILVQNCEQTTIASMTAYYNRGHASAHGIYCTANSYCSFSAISAYDNQGIGFAISGGNMNAAGVINTLRNDSHGVYLHETMTVLGTITSYDNGSHGIYALAGCHGCEITGATCCNNGGWGLILGATGGGVNCQANAVFANGNTSGQHSGAAGWWINLFQS